MNHAGWRERVDAAAAHLGGLVLTTPLLPSAHWSAVAGAEVRLKLENLQRTGSFKVRGASHALSRLTAEQQRRGVVAASSGNHGLGLAVAAREFGIAATVYVPTTTPADKVARIASAGAEVVVVGDDCVDTEAAARRAADASGACYVSPYNDLAVVAGQATVARELLRQWPDVEVVYVALGGGGLLGGMAAYGGEVAPQVEFVGCSPLASPALYECVRAGRVVDVACSDTWSDSTAGGVEPGAITLPLVAAHVARHRLVDEPSIVAAVAATLRFDHMLVEGAAGVALAALRDDPDLRGRRTAVVVCGGNLPQLRQQQLWQWLATEPR